MTGVQRLVHFCDLVCAGLRGPAVTMMVAAGLGLHAGACE